MLDIPPFLLHQWLGISSDEPAPTHYRLLGLAELEPETDVIEFVAGWRLKFIEQQMRGALSDVARRLREQMRVAQQQLLDPESKSIYDTQLRKLHPDWVIPPRATEGDDARQWLGVVSANPASPLDYLLVGIREDEADPGVLKSQFDQRLAMLRDLEKISTDDEQRRVSVILKALGQAERRLAKQLPTRVSQKSASPPPLPVAAPAPAAAAESESFDEFPDDLFQDMEALSPPLPSKNTSPAPAAASKSKSDSQRSTIQSKSKKGAGKSQVVKKQPVRGSDAMKWSIAGGIGLLCTVVVVVAVMQSRSSVKSDVSQQIPKVPVVEEPQEIAKVSPGDEDPPAIPESTSSSSSELLADDSPEPSKNEPTEPEPEPETSFGSAPSASSLASAEPMTEPEPETKSESDSAANDSSVGSLASAADLSAGVDGAIVTAASLMEAKKYPEAITALKKAGNQFPKEIRPDFYLGLLNSGVGKNDYKAAEFHFKRVLERSPGQIAALNNLALVEVKDHKISPARNFFTLAAKEQPRPFELDQNLGRILNQVRYFEIKADELKKITALNTNSGAYRPKTGWMYMPLDQTPRSLNEYRSFCINGNLEDRSCSRCGGKATVVCKKCGGKKMAYALGTASETRNIGINQPTMVTNTTPTSSVFACPQCRGAGRLHCDECKDGHDPSLGK